MAVSRQIWIWLYVALTLFGLMAYVLAFVWMVSVSAASLWLGPNELVPCGVSHIKLLTTIRLPRV